MANSAARRAARRAAARAATSASEPVPIATMVVPEIMAEVAHDSVDDLRIQLAEAKVRMTHARNEEQRAYSYLRTLRADLKYIDFARKHPGSGYTYGDRMHVRMEIVEAELAHTRADVAYCAACAECDNIAERLHIARRS